MHLRRRCTLITQCYPIVRDPVYLRHARRDRYAWIDERAILFLQSFGVPHLEAKFDDAVALHVDARRLDVDDDQRTDEVQELMDLLSAVEICHDFGSVWAGGTPWTRRAAGGVRTSAQSGCGHVSKPYESTSVMKTCTPRAVRNSF